jgi:CelD/BcsL family acetyltransferase involved in cellulose biosynthesis
MEETILTFSSVGFADKRPAIPGIRGMHVIEVGVDDPRLLAFVASHPGATVYHHPAWIQALVAEYKRKAVVLACEGEEGRLLGILPLMYTRGLPIPIGGELSKARLSSLPRTPIAGPLAATQDVSRMLLAAALDRVSGKSGVRLQIKTEGPIMDGLVEGIGGTPWRKSYVLSLPRNVADLVVRDHSVRKNLKRAKTSGLTVRVATSEEDLRNWYALYLRTMRRVVVPPRSLRYFLATWKHLGSQNLMKLFLAERQVEGKTTLIAGLIFFMYKERICAGFLACPAEHFQFRPNDLIHWEAIQWATANGYSEYDFGEVPDEEAELARFKMKFGAVPRMLYRYYYPHESAAKVDSAKLSTHQELIGRCWRRVPLSATSLLGDLIYSYM